MTNFAYTSLLAYFRCIITHLITWIALGHHVHINFLYTHIRQAFRFVIFMAKKRGFWNCLSNTFFYYERTV